jgi:hypothetical protein
MIPNNMIPIILVPIILTLITNIQKNAMIMMAVMGIPDEYNLIIAIVIVLILLHPILHTRFDLGHRRRLL